MTEKVKVGITIGDYNGIGAEVILKTFNEHMMYDLCTPVLYGSSKVLAYHKQHVNLDKINYQVVKDINGIHPKILNVINCWEEDVIFNQDSLHKRLETARCLHWMKL